MSLINQKGIKIAYIIDFRLKTNTLIPRTNDTGPFVLQIGDPLLVNFRMK